VQWMLGLLLARQCAYILQCKILRMRKTAEFGVHSEARREGPHVCTGESNLRKLTIKVTFLLMTTYSLVLQRYLAQQGCTEGT
jgi:hypothetical protein